jgi:hypothetical protein
MVSNCACAGTDEQYWCNWGIPLSSARIFAFLVFPLPNLLK